MFANETHQMVAYETRQMVANEIQYLNAMLPAKVPIIAFSGSLRSRFAWQEVKE